MEKKFSGLPVVEKSGTLVGIVTEGDLIKRVSHFESLDVIELLGGVIELGDADQFMEDVKQSQVETVRGVMSADVMVVHPNDTIEHTVTTMLQYHIKRLPVVDEQHKLLGIISRRDIMQHLYRR